MKIAVVLQPVTRALARAWAETLTRSWTFILVAEHEAFADMAAVEHRQRLQRDDGRHPPVRMCGMLVESDVLEPWRSVFH